MRRTVIFLVAALAAAALSAPARSGETLGGEQSCGARDEYVETFHVELARALKSTYEIGSTIRFVVRVTRPAHRDPASAGVTYSPPAEQPAEDVRVAVGVLAGPRHRKSLFSGGAITGQDGIAAVEVKIKGYARPGWADVRIYADRLLIEGPNGCPRTHEWGAKSIPEAFRITQP